jgi:hypothetical protein
LSRKFVSVELLLLDFPVHSFLLLIKIQIEYFILKRKKNFSNKINYRFSSKSFGFSATYKHNLTKKTNQKHGLVEILNFSQFTKQY